MDKALGCGVIIKDYFKNVLIIQKKVKKNQPKLWQLVYRNIKGKESEDKCVHRAVKEELKVLLFNASSFENIKVCDDEQHLKFYTGELQEKIAPHDDIVDYKWINKSNMDNYEFIPEHKAILESFFEMK